MSDTGKINPAREAGGGQRGSTLLMEGIRHGSRALCGPEHIWIDLTNKCNLACITCWHRSPLLPKSEVLPHWDARHELPLERVLSLVEEVAAMGARKIIYSGGGDPLLYGGVFRVIEHTSSLGLEILLISNLTMANEETIRRIIESGVTQLLVNLWAGSPEAYMATHPDAPEGAFERVARLMRRFVELRAHPMRPELIISDVICSRNYLYTEDLIRFAAEIGARSVWHQTVDVESVRLRALLLTREQINKFIGIVGAIRDRFAGVLPDYQRDMLYFDEVITKLRNSRAHEGIYFSDLIDTVPCYMGWAGCRILANGDVVPCCKADRHPLGNILANSFPKLWFSAAYDEFREKAKRCSKTDPYFSAIDCARACDNWSYNNEIHARFIDYLRGVKG